MNFPKPWGLSLHTMILSGIFMMLATVAQAVTFPADKFSNLDYGLYWFGNGDNWEKAVPGHSNSYFHNGRKTIIYIHGWEKDTVKDRQREGFNRHDVGGPDLNLAAAWRNAGWNVGVLYWNQFSDEQDVAHAEAKIWVTNGPQGMRWLKRNSNGSTSYQYNINQTATQLLFDNYRANMSGFYGSEVRFAGHSLGNQMAIALADKIRVAVDSGSLTSAALPDRIALLDPFYTKNARSYYGNQWAGELSRYAAFRLMDDGVKFEAYRSSSVTSTIFVGDDNKPLMDELAFTELKPWDFYAWQQFEKHQFAVTWYFWSFDFNTLPIKNSGDKAASAAASNSRISQLMNSNKKLVHDLGAYTQTPGDDRMKYVNR